MSQTIFASSDALSSLAAPPVDHRLLRIDAQVFRERFNRHHFMLEHFLTGHPLFQLPRLIELASDTARNRPNDLYYDEGVKDLNERWGTSVPSLPVEETIRRLEHCNSWIILKYAENDRAYAKVLDACMQDILEVSGRQLEKFMRRREVIIFITSPNRITTYHIDSEVNFLLQLHGTKEINVFNSTDRDVLPEDELERFWTIDSNAAVYKPQLQQRADVITLKPGAGIHIPINSPHWLQNGDNISVSVSINYHPWENERGNIYCVNYYLRNKLKFDPTPPFRSPTLDAIKRPIGAVISRARRMIHGPASNR